VTDDQDAARLAVDRELVEEVLDSLRGLAPALASRVGLIEVLGAGALERVSRRAVLLAVVALSQAPIVENRDGGVAEGDLGRLDGAREIGAEDDLDAVVPPAFPELAGEQASLVGETAGMPAAGNAAFVVFRDRMGLEHDLDGRGCRAAEDQLRVARVEAVDHSGRRERGAGQQRPHGRVRLVGGREKLRRPTHRRDELEKRPPDSLPPALRPDDEERHEAVAVERVLENCEAE
jgi:hypothetical protein